jgi:sporulation integral membrane protein YlbJ
MSKKFNSVLIMLIILFIGYEMLTDSKSILESVRFSFTIWIDNIFPALFPFFVISELLIGLGFVDLLGEILNPLMYKLFKTKGETGFVLAMSMVSGFPSGSKYTKELYDQNIINNDEASKLLCFTHFSSPLFILGTIAVIFLNNKEIGYLILLSHYITNFIIGIIIRNIYPSKINNNKISIRKALSKMHNKRINNNFGEIITNSITKSINTLLLILGIISMFLIVTTVLNNNINLNYYNKCLLNGTFEVTQGLKYLSMADYPLKIKTILATMFISFGGLSVHMQTISIISKTKIKYLPFFISRIIQALISGLIVYLLFDYWISTFI